MANVNVPHVKSYLIDDGDLTGHAKVSAPGYFYVGATVLVGSIAEASIRCVIESIQGSRLKLIKLGRNGQVDLTTFLVEDNAYVEQLAQTIPDDGLSHTSQLPLHKTTGPMTLWVDSVNGSDNNPGTQALPFATIQYPLDNVIPDNIEHAVVINVKAGVYTGLHINKNIMARGGRLSIIGVDDLTPTLASGVTSGTFTGNSGRAGVMATGTWTTNNLRKMFLKISSGFYNGFKLPITDNTATNIGTPAYANTTNGGAQVSGAVFSITQPAAIIQQDPNDPSTKYCCFITCNNTQTTTVFLRNLWFQSTNHGIGCNCAIQVYECLFDETVTGDPIIDLDNTYMILQYSSIYRVGNTGNMIDMSGFSGSGYWQYNSIIGGQYAYRDGGYIKMENQYFSGQQYGIWLETPGHVGLTNCTIENCTSSGIGVGGSMQVLILTQCTIQNNTLDGIEIRCPQAQVYAAATGVLNNGRFGINLHGTLSGVQNQVKVSVNAVADTGTNTIFTGNVSGDFSLDGVAGISKATLVADADNTMTDPVFLNILQGGV